MCGGLSANSFGLWQKVQRLCSLLLFYLPVLCCKSSQLRKQGMRHIDSAEVIRVSLRTDLTFLFSTDPRPALCPHSMLPSVTGKCTHGHKTREAPQAPSEALKLWSYLYKPFKYETLKARALTLNAQQLVLELLCVVWAQRLYFQQLQSWGMLS